MALRLKYADVPCHRIEVDTLAALDILIDATQDADGADVCVAATYTAMLDLRRRLTRKAGAPSVWSA